MKRVASLLFVFIAIFIFPTQAFAVDYSIENMHIDAHLEENGDVNVTETQTYTFKGKFNGISRTLIPKKNSSIVDFKATEDHTPLEVKLEDGSFRIYRSGKDETVTITTTYTIKDGMEVYTDVAQFYWPFFDEGNESTYEKLDIIIHPPKTTTDVIAFGYDAAEDTAHIKSDGTVHFSLGKVPGGNNGDTRVAYDQSLFPAASLTSDRAMKDEILADQQALIDKKIAFEKRKDTLSKYAPYIIGFFTLYFLALLFYAWQKRQMTIADVERRYTPPFFVPEQTMSLPATIFYTSGGMVKTEALTASMLDLVRKGFIKQEDEETFRVIHRNTDHEHEAHLIQWLFDKIGHKDVFKVEDLKTYTDNKENLKTYQKDYMAWQQAVQEEVRSNEMREKHTVLRSIIAITSLTLIPLFIIFAVHELFLAMFLSLVFLIALILFAALFRPRTAKGVKIKKEWDEFREKYIEFEEKEWDELEGDDQKRAYIYGFGINDKRINSKNEILLNKDPLVNYADPNPLFFVLFATTMNSSFSKANTAAAESSMSTGGPIGGGGAGVGGGGGGSGAF